MSFLNNLFRYSRHALIRIWELFPRVASEIEGTELDFWLVCHSKDAATALLTIESIKENSLNSVRKIYLVGNEKETPSWLSDEDVIYIWEGELPVTQIVVDTLKGSPYMGWVLQQVLKYSGVEHSDRFVVIDCDTVLLKKHAFFDADTSLLRLAYEHSPHYKMFERSLGVSAASFLSFTCHMMPYQANVLKNLLRNIEAKHGVHWARYFAEYARDHGMVVNEQDLYARYLISTGRPIRYVPWLNKTVPFSANENIQDLAKRYSNRNCVSLHNNEDRKLIIK